MKNIIDYSIVDKAIHYYDNLDYKYIDVPWVVDWKIIEITAPQSMLCFAEDTAVASGEQSFLSLIDNNLLSIGKYCCATPCFRPNDIEDDLHSHYFFKVELIDYSKEDYSIFSLEKMINDARRLMSDIRNSNELSILEVKDEKRKDCETIVNYDIMSNDVELGSYGIRKNDKIGYWIYGTGVALPRIQYDKLVK